MRSVRGKVAEAEVVVGHGEHLRGELLVIGLASPFDVAGAPAGVDGFPIAIVDFHGIPGVVGILCRNRRAGCERGGESKALAMATYHYGLKTSFCGKSSEEACVAFTDGEAAGECGSGCGRFDSVVEEGNHVVLDIVMQPGEYTASLIGGGRERSYQLQGQPVERGDRLTREFCSVGIRSREVAAD